MKIPYTSLPTLIMCKQKKKLDPQKIKLIKKNVTQADHCPLKVSNSRPKIEIDRVCSTHNPKTQTFYVVTKVSAEFVNIF